MRRYRCTRCANESELKEPEERGLTIHVFATQNIVRHLTREKAQHSMAVYHLKVSVGSRDGGQSARAKDAYIEREDRYAQQDPEECEHVEHGHMPAWVQDDPRTYWAASDDHERANGRLYREVQFALPNELSPEARRELAGRFAAQLTDVGEEGKLPYTLAIHKGASTDPDKPDNPHAHLMFSERVNDGIERSAEQWFKRHNPKSPARGGAKKSRAAVPQEWLEKTRQAWQETANQALEQAGREERIDGRSLADRRDAAERDGNLELAAELSREPNVHLDPLVVKKEMRAVEAGEPPDDPTVQRSYDVRRDNRELERERAAPDDQQEAEQTRISWLEQELDHLAKAIREVREYVEQAMERAREWAKTQARQASLNRDESRGR